MFEELKKISIENEASEIARRLYGFDSQSFLDEENLETVQENTTDDQSKNQAFFCELRKA